MSAAKAVKASSPIYECPVSQVFAFILPHIKDKLSQSIQDKLRSGLISNGINGESLLFIDHICLIEMGIKHIRPRNIILSSISTLYEYQTFSSYIASFPNLKAYEKHFIQSKIDLNTFGRKSHSANWYQTIGITNTDDIIHFQQILQLSSFQIKCCNHVCKKTIKCSSFESLETRIKNNAGYIANEYALKYKKNPLNFFTYIHGKYVRVFCNSCKLNLKKCQHSNCKNHDKKSDLFADVNTEKQQQTNNQRRLRRIYNYISNYRYYCYNHEKCKQCESANASRFGTLIKPMPAIPITASEILPKLFIHISPFICKLCVFF